MGFTLQFSSFLNKINRYCNEWIRYRLVHFFEDKYITWTCTKVQNGQWIRTNGSSPTFFLCPTCLIRSSELEEQKKADTLTNCDLQMKKSPNRAIINRTALWYYKLQLSFFFKSVIRILPSAVILGWNPLKLVNTSLHEQYRCVNNSKLYLFSSHSLPISIKNIVVILSLYWFSILILPRLLEQIKH